MELVRRKTMIRSGLRTKAIWMAGLLLALGVSSLQGVPAHAYLSDEQQREGEVSLDFEDNDPGEFPKHPGGPGGPGGNDGTRRADPDDLSFNNPRVDSPVVAAPSAARPAWFGMLRVWLSQLFAHFMVAFR
jgi:hypothetical protein